MLDLVSWKSLLALSMPWNTCGRGVAGGQGGTPGRSGKLGRLGGWASRAPRDGTAAHLGDVPEVEQVVDFRGRGQEALHHRVVHVQGGLSHHIADGLHLLLEVLQLLVDHGAEYSGDLRLLGTGPDARLCQLLACLPDPGEAAGFRGAPNPPKVKSNKVFVRYSKISGYA